VRPGETTISRAVPDGAGTFITLREVHYQWAQEYINQWVDDPRGTSGAPFMAWLRQLIDETRSQKR
jgi:hypothetical protein